MTIRIVRTSPLPYSQQVAETVQQFIDGEWRNVEVVNTWPYPVPPHTMTNRGHLRDIG